MDALKNPNGAPAALESILCTEELKRRPTRPPDYQAENQALLTLAQELTSSPGSVLQSLMDIALELCRAHSAGISLLEKGPPGHVSPSGDHFRWHAVAGQWAPLIWDTTTRRDDGPCGTVLDRNCTLLFANAHRYYAQFTDIEPLLIEGLLVPFHVNGRAVGTVWVVAHDESRKFDAEDQRLLESLATFAATAYQAQLSVIAEAKANHALREREWELELVNAKIQAINSETDRLNRLLVDSVQEYAIFMLDPQGYVASWNTGAERINGYAAREIIGRHFSVFYPAEVAQDKPGRLLEIAAREGRIEDEEWRVQKDGSRFWASVIITALRDETTGELIGFGKVTRDLTERRATEERAIAAAKQVAAAEAANRTRVEFLAAICHELRTPLAAIASYVQLLEMEMRGPVTSGQRKDLERIQRNQRYLLSLINDLMSFAKLELGRVEYAMEDVRLADVVADIGPVIEPQLASKGLAYEVDAAYDLVVRADRDKLGRILINLLSNAVKFTDRGGRITVSTDGRAGMPGVAFLRVSDTGCGIPREKLDTIFEPFVQLENDHTRKTEGTGLGLAISRNLARGMGGDLEAYSVEGKGTTFTVTLHAASAEHDEKRRES